MIDPAIARFVAESERFYPPDVATLGVADQRRLYDAYAATFAVHRPKGVTSLDGSLAVADRAIPLRLYHPDRVLGDGVIAYAHGGGFMLGSLDSHDGVVARVAAETGATVIAVDYRLAPEYRAPAALDDVVAVAAAILERRLPWNDLPSGGFALMGDSAGGTLACAAALRLGRMWPGQLRALGLIYPALGFEPAEPARSRWAEAPMLTLADVRFYRSVYLADVDRGAHAFPLDEPDLSALPPTALLKAEIDPLCDDCTVLAERLRAIGTEVMLLPGTGLVHGALRALDRAPAMAEPFAQLCAFVAARLKR